MNGRACDEVGHEEVLVDSLSDGDIFGVEDNCLEVDLPLAMPVPTWSAIALECPSCRRQRRCQ